MTKLMVAFRNYANVPNKTSIQLFIKYYYEVKTKNPYPANVENRVSS